MKKLLYICLLVSYTLTGHTQPLDETTRKQMELSDGIKINLFSTADEPHKYYYLPTTMQLAVKDSQPEISLIVYKHGDTGPIEGGILHLLLRWGLSPEQEQMVTTSLKDEDSTAVLVGAAEIELPEKNSIDLIPGDPIADLLLRSASQAIRIPEAAMNKTAASFHFKGDDAAKFLEAMGRPEQMKKIRYTTRYTYTIAQYKDGVRITEKREGKIEGSMAQWINTLVKMHGLKTETI